MVITNELTSTSPTQLVAGQKYTTNKTAGMVTVPSSGDGQKLGFPISSTPPGPGRGKQGGTLRNCVYYQNRFIILDPVDDKAQLSTEKAENRVNKPPASSCDPSSGWQDGKIDAPLNETGDLSFENYVRAANTDSVGRNHRKTGGKMEMDASSVTMVPRGIEVVIDDGEGGSPRRMHTGIAPPRENNSILKKIWSILQDNRMKGRDDWEAVLNSTRPEDHRVLKKILNIIFLTIGVSLLLSVIIVVIYATVVEETRGPYIPPGSNDLPPSYMNEGQSNDTQGGSLSAEQSVNFDLEELTFRQ
ncbi:uncharacterized protein LOC135473034 isoform X2 [Liolophura sinensis]|uniref:uncharacterized protein LOC135473034 isoform X2 n=1 Tax=Liolophura sinensis TaxID=3198878 RepID=UPI00315980AA